MQKLFYNQILDKKGTKKILSWFLENYGPTRTSQFIEQLKSVGFHFATEAGLSLGFDDLRVPLKKSILLNTAESDVFECEKRFFQGKITAVERYQKLIDIWTTASENLKDEVIQNFQNTDLLNPLYMMAFSGARGNISQVRQLVGMRGLMSDSAGGIIDFPIRSNFREGLTVTEYAISCYGARKGLIDTALRTADSGYLTRRLVDVAHGIMIGRLECNTDESFDIAPLKANGKSGSESILLSLEKRIVGRVLAENISLKNSSGTGGSNFSVGGLPQGACSAKPNPQGWGNSPPPTPPGKPHKSVQTELWSPGGVATRSARNPDTEAKKEYFIAYKNQEISPSIAQKIVQYKKENVRVRSPLTCLHFQNLREDICQLCYGWSLAHSRLVSIGEAVGILAAQSIGEPGTQLTMRTFHTGGIFSTDIDAKIFAPHDGIIAFSTLSGEGEASQGKLELTGRRGSNPQNPSPVTTNSVTVKGRKIRTFHGETAFFTFEPIQLKIRRIFSPSLSLNLSPGGESSQEVNSPVAAGACSAKPNPHNPPLRQNKENEVFSIFCLPAHSLIFVYPGQHIKKNVLCAEVSQLISAKKGSRNNLEISSETINRLAPQGFLGSVGEVPLASADLSTAPPNSVGSFSGRAGSASPNRYPGERKPKNRLRTVGSPLSQEVIIRPDRPGDAKVDKTSENEIPDELNKPNSKRVLSEIEGQIYFHRLAERRQIGEFSLSQKLSHVKGVGSLWVLAGKGVFTHGPFQSGDFITKTFSRKNKSLNFKKLQQKKYKILHEILERPISNISSSSWTDTSNFPQGDPGAAQEISSVFLPRALRWESLTRSVEGRSPTRSGSSPPENIEQQSAPGENEKSQFVFSEIKNWIIRGPTGASPHLSVQEGQNIDQLFCFQKAPIGKNFSALEDIMSLSPLAMSPGTAPSSMTQNRQRQNSAYSGFAPQLDQEIYYFKFDLIKTIFAISNLCPLYKNTFYEDKQVFNDQIFEIRSFSSSRRKIFSRKLTIQNIFYSNWLEKQISDPFPPLAIFAYSFVSQSRSSNSTPLFLVRGTAKPAGKVPDPGTESAAYIYMEKETRLRRSKKLNIYFSLKQKMNFDSKVVGSFGPALCLTADSHFFIFKTFSFLSPALRGKALRPVSQNPGRAPLLSPAATHGLVRVSAQSGVSTPDTGNSDKAQLPGFAGQRPLPKNGLEIKASISPDFSPKIKNNQQLIQSKISLLPFAHGELRYLQDLRKEKRDQLAEDFSSLTFDSQHNLDTSSPDERLGAQSVVHPGDAGSASPNRDPGQDTLLTGAKRQVSGHFPRLPRRGRSPKRRDVRGAHSEQAEGGAKYQIQISVTRAK